MLRLQDSSSAIPLGRPTEQGTITPRRRRTPSPSVFENSLFVGFAAMASSESSHLIAGGEGAYPSWGVVMEGAPPEHLGRKGLEKHRRQRR